MRRSKSILLFVFVLAGYYLSAQQVFNISSPRKKIKATIWINQQGEARYKIFFNNQEVLKESKLGLIINDGSFADSLKLVRASKIFSRNESYILFTGKKSRVTTKAHHILLYLHNRRNNGIAIEFRVSDDGVAFRYFLVARDSSLKIVSKELSSFHFDTAARGFLQPMQVSKTGWNQVNPCYEEHYQQGIPVTTHSTHGAGWVYPSLFQYKNTWLLISESSVDSNYCGTHLSSATTGGELFVDFPDHREIFSGGGYLPQFTSSIYSPWRGVSLLLAVWVPLLNQPWGPTWQDLQQLLTHLLFNPVNHPGAGSCRKMIL
jgi:alpha-glucosidase